jgi:hypothetical protein
MKTYKLTIEAKQGTYKVLVIESAWLLIVVRFIGSLGIMYPLTTGTIGITLSRVILIKPNLMYDSKQRLTATARHEFIHVVQQRESGLFLFILRYLYYFIKTKSYAKIPFEIEAYNHHDEQYYHWKRNKNDWRLYL